MSDQTKKKVYAGSATEFNTLNVSICLDDVPKDFIKSHSNGKKYVNFRIRPRKGEGIYGETHSVEVVDANSNG